MNGHTLTSENYKCIYRLLSNIYERKKSGCAGQNYHNSFKISFKRLIRLRFDFLNERKHNDSPELSMHLQAPFWHSSDSRWLQENERGTQTLTSTKLPAGRLTYHPYFSPKSLPLFFDSFYFFFFIFLVLYLSFISEFVFPLSLFSFPFSAALHKIIISLHLCSPLFFFFRVSSLLFTSFFILTWLSRFSSLFFSFSFLWSFQLLFTSSVLLSRELQW